MIVQNATVRVDVFLSVFAKETTGNRAILTVEDKTQTLQRHKPEYIQYSNELQVIAEYDGDRVYLDFLYTTPTHSGMWSNEKDLFACRWGDRQAAVGTFNAHLHTDDDEDNG